MARMHCSASPRAVTDADDGRPRSRAHRIRRLDLTRSAGLRRCTRGQRLAHTARLRILLPAAPCSRERRERGDDGAASTARDPDGVSRPSGASRNMQRVLYLRGKFSPHTRAPPTKRKCLQRRTGDSMHGLSTSHRAKCSHPPQPLLPSPCFSPHLSLHSLSFFLHILSLAAPSPNKRVPAPAGAMPKRFTPRVQ